ncbi:MAG: hypothetical protein SGPRY_007883 [Prymnesium sp.]
MRLHTPPHLSRSHAKYSSAAAPSHALLRRSRIPTMHFQRSLPKLPIPKLHSSLERLRYFASPVVDPSELHDLDRCIAEFSATHGPRLQAELVALDNSRYSSYISEPWFDLYLTDRRPLLLNYNPQLTFRDEEGEGRVGGGGSPPTSPPSQPRRAARLAHAAMAFLRALESGQLEPDVFHTKPSRSMQAWWPELMRLLPPPIAFYGAAAFGAFPLDMSQYQNLFRSTRVPGVEKDKLVVAEGSTHVVVQRAGRFWKLELLEEGGEIVPLEEIYASMQVDTIASHEGSAFEAPAHSGSFPCPWTFQRSLLSFPRQRAVLEPLPSTAIRL